MCGFQCEKTHILENPSNGITFPFSTLVRFGFCHHANF